MGINSDWDKWTRTDTPPWEWSENKHMRDEARRYKGRLAMDDLIRKATPKGNPAYYKALNAKPGMKEAAKGLARTAAPRALGFMANPWLATIAGMFAPTQMGNSEFIGSPEHQQWLARRGPLAKR